MITLHAVSDLTTIKDFKAQYLRSLVAPMDGMWEVGFTNSAPHWEIYVDGESAGYYAANDGGTLLQFYVAPAYVQFGRAMFEYVIAQDNLKQATVSTIDPTFLSYCLDVQQAITVHTYLYEAHDEVRPAHPEADGLSFRLVEPGELDRTVALQQACLDGAGDLHGWLMGYSSDLIQKKQLFVLCRGSAWLGFGEYRKSESQHGIVDLGMMVSPDHRKKGWATYILTHLAARCRADGLRAICSTTVSNTGAQKAITRSGFVSRHRIMNVSF